MHILHSNATEGLSCGQLLKLYRPLSDGSGTKCSNRDGHYLVRAKKPDYFLDAANYSPIGLHA